MQHGRLAIEDGGDIDTGRRCRPYHRADHAGRQMHRCDNRAFDRIAAPLRLALNLRIDAQRAPTADLAAIEIKGFGQPARDGDDGIMQCQITLSPIGAGILRKREQAGDRRAVRQLGRARAADIGAGGDQREAQTVAMIQYLVDQFNRQHGIHGSPLSHATRCNACLSMANYSNKQHPISRPPSRGRQRYGGDIWRSGHIFC